MYLIGETSSGHHQIELACETCHTSPFGGTELLQEACEGCHLEELAAVRDSHPKRKFTDPGNIDRVEILDARLCVTCHREHQEEITSAMGLTVPEDVCFLCHENIGEERETHTGLSFDTCATSGCHNFHDNTALYETFLVDNAGHPDISPEPLVASLNAVEAAILNQSEDLPDSPFATSPATPFTPPTPDAPAQYLNTEITSEWLSSAHAQTHTQSQVNCMGCHSENEQGSNQHWIEKPNFQQCESCHDSQTEGFLAGKHGMRLSVGLPPMTPALARIPMHESSSHLELGCASCHSSHDFNLQQAAIESCQGCHNSDHVNAYTESPHFSLAQRAFSGQAPEESAVTCASCHMPRESIQKNGVLLTQVQHNQNLNLRPNDKMLRSVCMNCHSLSFSIDALADTALINNNFNGRPSVHVESIDMALERRAGISDRDNTYR